MNAPPSQQGSRHWLEEALTDLSLACPQERLSNDPQQAKALWNRKLAVYRSSLEHWGPDTVCKAVREWKWFPSVAQIEEKCRQQRDLEMLLKSPRLPPPEPEPERKPLTPDQEALVEAIKRQMKGAAGSMTFRRSSGLHR